MGKSTRLSGNFFVGMRLYIVQDAVRFRIARVQTKVLFPNRF